MTIRKRSGFHLLIAQLYRVSFAALASFCIHSQVLAEEPLRKPFEYCQSSSYAQALPSLLMVYGRTVYQGEKVLLAVAIAQTYIQIHQAEKAGTYLHFAVDNATKPVEKAQYEISLGNWQQNLGQAEQARLSYESALKLAPDDMAISLSVGLNLNKLDAKSLSIPVRLQKLQTLSQGLPALADLNARARFNINLGVQAKALGKEGLSLAYASFENARELASAKHNDRLLAEALDHLAQLYEDQQRNIDALALTDKGVMAAQLVNAYELLMNLESRRGRILRQQAQTEQAIAAYQRAVVHIETIRSDIPVEYQDGKSSFRETLEPVYLALADLLLQSADKLEPEQKDMQLRRARIVLELSKQTELQDYLGDRCAVESARANHKKATIQAGTAILYPVIFTDRLELLLETANGLQHRSVAVSSKKLRAEVENFIADLRSGQAVKPQAKKMYASLLAPVDALLEQEKISTLVIVPDGVLRMLPFAALHDGQRYAVEKYAIAVVPALTLTDSVISNNPDKHYKTLLAGMSEPGAVVDKLPDFMVTQLLATDTQAGAGGRQIARGVLTRSLRGNTQRNFASAAEVKINAASPLNKQQHQQLQQLLALAGVDQEIKTLQKLAPGNTLLNADFTVAAFGQKVQTGDFQIVHIASHGVFGGNAEDTFLMAHDDLINMDKLQNLLRAGNMKNKELELLTLSACETAEGDDRAPLGLSGAALNAHAKSALGSLWPVSDDAATMLMGQFYRNLAMPGVSKAQALQKAQLELLSNESFNHPFYWAPFIMVGSWL
ncbi:CHAT domain-containing protein [Undibacterium sp. TJN19]|uniref:CHAT domain-containing protein n=1 Tax=Undibacterium sp. TJN19 TaxID=3413055 RepID=UPI003BF16058